MGVLRKKKKKKKKNKANYYYFTLIAERTYTTQTQHTTIYTFVDNKRSMSDQGVRVNVYIALKNDSKRRQIPNFSEWVNGKLEAENIEIKQQPAIKIHFCERCNAQSPDKICPICYSRCVEKVKNV